MAELLRYSTSRQRSVFSACLGLALALHLAAPRDASANPPLPNSVYVQMPELALDGIPFSLSLHWAEALPTHLRHVTVVDKGIDPGVAPRPMQRDVKKVPPATPKSWADDFALRGSGLHRVEVWVNGRRVARRQLRVLPAALVLLPPFLAVLIGLISRQFILALALGVWAGASLLEGFDPFRGMLRVVDTHVIAVCSTPWRAALLIVMALTGGLVGVIIQSGGARALADFFIARKLRRKGAQWLLLVLGFLFLTLDFVSTLLVGASARDLCDRLRISREKLAFLIDTTAAPVAGIGLVSTWTFIEVDFLQQHLAPLRGSTDVYALLVAALPYQFYPGLMVFLALLLTWQARELGPMAKAELRALRQGRPFADDAWPAANLGEESICATQLGRSTWLLAVLPVAFAVVAAAAGHYLSGTRALEREDLKGPVLAAQADRDPVQAEQELLQAQGPDVSTPRARPRSLLDYAHRVMGHSNYMQTWIWTATLSGLLALLLALGLRALGTNQAVEAWMRGLQAVVPVCLVIILASALSRVCETLQVGNALWSLLAPRVQAELLPALVFLLASLLSFVTGSSFGTFAMLIPVLSPLLAAQESAPILHASLGALVAGATFGDHCSPVSDTTIVASIASSCDHLHHVRTQLPYALLTALISVTLGHLGTSLGWYPLPVAWLLGALALFLTLRYFGTPIRPEERSSQAKPRS